MHDAGPEEHLLKTMDNAAFEANGDTPRRAASTVVELGEITALPGRPAGSSLSAPSKASVPLCKPDVCRAMAPPAMQAKTPVMRPNPWHRYKTVFLVATIVGLVVWAVAYFFLDRNKLI